MFDMQYKSKLADSDAAVSQVASHSIVAISQGRIPATGLNEGMGSSRGSRSDR